MDGTEGDITVVLELAKYGKEAAHRDLELNFAPSSPKTVCKAGIYINGSLINSIHLMRLTKPATVTILRLQVSMRCCVPFV